MLEFIIFVGFVVTVILIGKGIGIAVDWAFTRYIYRGRTHRKEQSNGKAIR